MLSLKFALSNSCICHEKFELMLVSMQLILVNFRKEILPFIPKTEEAPKQEDTASEDCSDVLIVNDSMAFLGHNEDANVALVDHT